MCIHIHADTLLPLRHLFLDPDAAALQLQLQGGGATVIRAMGIDSVNHRSPVVITLKLVGFSRLRTSLGHKARHRCTDM